MEAPDYYHHQTFASGEGESKPGGGGGGEHFLVEDLLDFSNDDNGVVTTNDIVMEDESNNNFLVPPGGANGNYSSSTTDQDSSTVTTAVDSCNSSGSDHNNNNINATAFSSLDPHFCNDLSVPYDDLAELEWLSNFVEESFSSEDLQKLHLISGIKARPDDSSGTSIRVDPVPNSVTMHNVINNPNPIFHPETMSVPAKARSKRSRAAPMNWASRLLVLADSSSSPSSSSDGGGARKPAPARKQRALAEGEGGGEGRKCLHCATDKTPQWRTGPMGPKTLCNACGVRYKSGRLVPEYRPAASPTFVLTKHSNSHRKVLELRRQKEMVRAQHHHHHQFLHHHHHHPGAGGMVFDMGSSNGDDFLIHQHVGPDFRQLI